MALPPRELTDEFFVRLKALLWGVFDVVLIVLAMAAIVEFAVTHIRAGS
jgi:hypothetical protein